MPTHLEKVNLFRHEFPEEFFRDFVPMLERLYRVAEGTTIGLVEHAQRFAYPQLLRALVESAFLTKAAAHGLNAHVEYNRSKDGHTLALTDNFAMTESRTRRANLPPRRADFRLKYARLAQFWLPHPMFANEPPPVDAREGDDEPRIYIVLAHGSRPGHPHELGFLYANFVAADGHSYAGPGVDVLAWLAAEPTQTPDENVIPEPQFPAQPEKRPDEQAGDTGG